MTCASKARYAVGSSRTSTTVSAVNPCLTAFCRDRRFPCSALGPVLLREFRRLAWNWRREVMDRPARPAAQGLGRFPRLPALPAGWVHTERHRRPEWPSFFLACPEGAFFSTACAPP